MFYMLSLLIAFSIENFIFSLFSVLNSNEKHRPDIALHHYAQFSGRFARVDRVSRALARLLALDRDK